MDGERIDLTEHQDLNFWTHEFHCTAHQLVAALSTVGVKATAVRAHLRRLRATAPGNVHGVSSESGRGVHAAAVQSHHPVRHAF